MNYLQALPLPSMLLLGLKIACARFWKFPVREVWADRTQLGVSPSHWHFETRSTGAASRDLFQSSRSPRDWVLWPGDTSAVLSPCLLFAPWFTNLRNWQWWYWSWNLLEIYILIHTLPKSVGDSHLSVLGFNLRCLAIQELKVATICSKAFHLQSQSFSSLLFESCEILRLI